MSHVRIIYDLIYGEGIQPDSLEGIDVMGKRLGIEKPAEAVKSHDFKEILKRNTENAVNDGVFGVPTFVVNGELFWGGDATDMMLDFLHNPKLFETSEMKRISEMPMGKTRKK